MHACGLHGVNRYGYFILTSKTMYGKKTVLEFFTQNILIRGNSGEQGNRMRKVTNPWLNTERDFTV